MQVNVVEAFWVAVNLTSLVVTLGALWDAIENESSYKRLSFGKERTARIVAAMGNIRREVLRALMQFLLLSLVVPQLFRPGEILFTFDLTTPEGVQRTIQTLFVVNLIAIPVVMLVQTLADWRDRRLIASMSLEQVLTERQEVDARIEATLEMIVASAEGARTEAAAAYHEANNANEKLGRLADQVDLGDRRFSDEMRRTDRHQDKQDTRIDDQDDLIAGGGGGK
jgi:hypothetical protein